MMTRMDSKLENIRAGRYRRTDFLIADAKDADMGSGVVGLGTVRNPDGTVQRYRTRQEFLDAIVEIIEQDIVDIMLVSASNLDQLHKRGAFRDSAIKPAVRANDTSDCWSAIRHGKYAMHPSHPFATASIPRVMFGAAKPEQGAPVTGTDLGLYSLTFVNDLEIDIAAQQQFRQFRAEAAKYGFKYFFEVFNPNVDIGLSREQMGEFVNDCILRCLAGVNESDRPLFLKMPFNGAKALEELASFDSGLIVGILGGGAGTTRDTFELLHQAEKYGGRLALFGRKINLAERPLALVSLMRQVADGTIAPEEAVKAYHGELQKAGVRPARALEDDRMITEAVLKPAVTLRVAGGRSLEG
jgi:hypothetical protein